MSVTITPPLPAPSAPEPSPMTAEEFCRRFADRRAELVKGVVRELPMPWPKHGKMCLTIGAHLFNWATEGNHGHVMSNDSFVQTGKSPDSVRGPDVCYFGYERLPRGPVPDGLLPVAPDLVVEVKSPTDQWGEVFAKIGEYLRVGVRAVVVLDAASLTASVYRPTELQQIVPADGELTVPDVLPGFAVRVGRLFE